MAAIAAKSADKASFVYSSMKTRLIVNIMKNDLVYASKQLMVVTAAAHYD